MKTKKILALALSALMLFSFAGCRKTNTADSGEWLSERDYYQYVDGEWVQISDPSIFDNAIVSDEGKDDNGGSTTGGNKNNTTAVDSSKYKTVIDYCGNDGFDKTVEHTNMQIDNYAGDVLEDDYRFRRNSDLPGSVTWKTDGIAEFFVEYSKGTTARYSNSIKFLVSPDNKTWTEVKAQDEFCMIFNGNSWIRTRAYFGNVDPKNQYLKITIDTDGQGDGAQIYNPSLFTVQINGLDEAALSKLGMYNSALPATNIYVDSVNGNDKNDGKSEKTALKTLYAASKKTYSPGSKLLLKAGCEFSGSIDFIGSGTAKKPITITSYGKGAKPVINARGGTALQFYGEYITITGLKITNKTGSNGIRGNAAKPGATRGINITKCDFENININFKFTGNGNGGIVLGTTSAEPSWYDGVNVSDCTFKDVARVGIVLGGTDWTTRDPEQAYGKKNDLTKGEYFPSVNVVVRNNKLNHVGGDGILLFGCRGGLVEGNVVADTELFKNQGEIHWVAIWCHSSDACLFQYNEVYGNKATNEGYDLQAFDADIANTDCIFQYNYSHENAGGFMLTCATETGETSGTIVRYNLSVNDGSEGGFIFDITGPCHNGQFYNNTIYNDKFDKISVFHFSNYNAGGVNHARNTTITNNIVYAGGKTKIGFDFTKQYGVTLNNNVFYNMELPQGLHVTATNNIQDKPQLVQPGFTGNGRETVAAKYKPTGGFVLEKGIAVANSGGKDMLGKNASNTLLGALMK